MLRFILLANIVLQLIFSSRNNHSWSIESIFEQSMTRYVSASSCQYLIACSTTATPLSPSTQAISSCTSAARQTSHQATKVGASVYKHISPKGCNCYFRWPAAMAAIMASLAILATLQVNLKLDQETWLYAGPIGTTL